MGIIYENKKYIKIHEPRHIDDTHILNIVYDILENTKDNDKWRNTMGYLEVIQEGFLQDDNLCVETMEWLDSIDENYFEFTETTEFSTFDGCYFPYEQWIQSLRKVQDQMKSCPYVPVI